MIKLEKTTAYDTVETAEKLGVTVNTIRRYLREGRIRCQKIGHKYYVTEDTLKEFLDGEARK